MLELDAAVMKLRIHGEVVPTVDVDVIDVFVGLQCVKDGLIVLDEHSQKGQPEKVDHNVNG